MGFWPWSLFFPMLFNFFLKKVVTKKKKYINKIILVYWLNMCQTFQNWLYQHQKLDLSNKHTILWLIWSARYRWLFLDIRLLSQQNLEIISENKCWLKRIQTIENVGCDHHFEFVTKYWKKYFNIYNHMP